MADTDVAPESDTTSLSGGDLRRLRKGDRGENESTPAEPQEPVEDDEA